MLDLLTLPLSDFLIKAVNATNDIIQCHFSIRSYISSPLAFLYLYIFPSKNILTKGIILSLSNHTFKNNSMMHRFPLTWD